VIFKHGDFFWLSNDFFILLYFWWVSITRTELRKKKKKYHHGQISISDLKIFCASYLVYSQIWQNQPRDDMPLEKK
jgi:hypothetical protein